MAVLVVAPVPADVLANLQVRLGESMVVGNEGSGVVVAAGSAPEAQALATDAFLGLPPRARACVMSVIPGGGTAPTRLVNALVDDDEIGLPLAIARFSTTPTSSAIVRGLESDDPRIRRMAEAARDLAISIEEAAAREFTLDAESK